MTTRTTVKRALMWVCFAGLGALVAYPYLRTYEAGPKKRPEVVATMFTADELELEKRKAADGDQRAARELSKYYTHIVVDREKAEAYARQAGLEKP